MSSETVAELRAYLLAHRKGLPKVTSKKAVLLETALKLGYVMKAVPEVKVVEEVPLIIKRERKQLETRIEPSPVVGKDMRAKPVIERSSKMEGVSKGVAKAVKPAVEPAPKGDAFSRMNAIRKENPTMTRKEVGEKYRNTRLGNLF